nr:hypothetical protein [Desulfobulbaceae bacterium]
MEFFLITVGLSGVVLNTLHAINQIIRQSASENNEEKIAKSRVTEDSSLAK